MTVEELIVELQKLPKDMKVYSHDEGGEYEFDANCMHIFSCDEDFLKYLIYSDSINSPKLNENILMF
jgi:hypothetical protein